MKKRILVSLIALAFLAVYQSEQIEANDDARRTAAEALENYFASWNEPDAGKRAALLEACWAKDGTYTDPTAHVEGREALVAHIGGFLGNPQFKGFSIVRISGIDEHHDSFRFEWEMRNPAGQPITKGMDYGEIDSDGNIRKIVGFFGPFPAKV